MPGIDVNEVVILFLFLFENIGEGTYHPMALIRSWMLDHRLKTLCRDPFRGETRAPLS